MVRFQRLYAGVPSEANFVASAWFQSSLYQEIMHLKYAVCCIHRVITE